MPGFAQAQTVAYGAPSSPIIVASVRTEGQFAPWSATGGYAAQAGLFALDQRRGSIALRFVNQSSVPVTAVTFVVNTDGDSHHIVDKGLFSPGVPIEHTFVGFNGLPASANATCEVAEVLFADGSAWHRPNRGIDAVADHNAQP